MESPIPPPPSRSRAFSIRGLLPAAVVLLLLAGCQSLPATRGLAASVTPPAKAPGAEVTPPAPSATRAASGDEIIVAGQRFHTGTRIVTWTEPGGHNAYAGHAPKKRREASRLTHSDNDRIARQGWDVPTLQKIVDQFVLHYDVCGVSKVCFDVLNARDLSVHFMLDIDGTIYQTLDLQERAPHATIANDRSIGIEIANIGAYPPDAAKPLAEWYRREPNGDATITIPPRIKIPGVLTPDFTGHPARPGPISGAIHGKPLLQYDFTPEQYAALAKLAAALCRVFPRIHADYPHGFFSDEPTPHALTVPKFASFHGILGHYHIQENKSDPGPAFDWKRFRAIVERELK